MSETGPKFNPAAEALNTFEADKQSHEEEVAREWMRTHWQKAQEFLNEGKAERDHVEQFGSEHRQVLEELVPVYEAQDRLAERTIAEREDQTLREEALASGETYPHNDLYEISDADSERRRAEEERVIEEAFQEKLNAKGKAGAKLRQMDRLSLELDTIRKAIDEGEAEESDLVRKEELENRLEELLVKYEASDDYNDDFAFYMMDRSDEARREAGLSALFEARDRAAKKKTTDAADPTATGSSTTSNVKDPGSVNTDPLENKSDDDDKNKDPGSVNTDPLEKDTKDPGSVNTDPLENKSDDKNKDPGSVNTNPLEGRGRNATETQPVIPVPERRERMSRGRKIALALGGAAVILVGAALASKGFTDNPLRGMGAWLPDWMRPTEVIEGHAVPSPDFVPDVPPAPPVDTLPPSTGFDYPWNWAEKAVGGDQAMGFLEGLANKAQAAGHAVEWHGSGTTRWVEVDGNSNTQYVIDTLRQFR